MLQQIKTKAILVLAFLLGGISVDMLAQQSVSEKKIGLPPNTVEGVLPNGLHYLILPERDTSSYDGVSSGDASWLGTGDG